jgi:hypothetical protein
MFLCGIFARSLHGETLMSKFIQRARAARFHRENLGKPHETHNEAMI